MAQDIKFTEHIATLSLPYLDEVNIRNLRHIATLRYKININSIIMFSSLSGLIISAVIALTIFRWRKNRQKRIVINLIENNITKAPGQNDGAPEDGRF